MNSITAFAPAPPEVTGALLRQTTGRFATGITVITVPTADGTHHGMTANGFVSVSLEPPLVLVSLGNHTRTKGLVAEGSRLGISVLAEHQKDVALHFSGKPQPAEPALVEVDGVAAVDSAIARMNCTVIQQHVAGDHTLVVARVDSASYSAGDPLVFNQGRMIALGQGVAA
ncbi:flavin reductase family protein [Arthrobacter sp. KNU40]|uniref:flavin reductase family protein n=1 Tax=Arthrobacter sp. KNU40 TaxID=3447965 RepID=UPI003F5EFD42